MLISVARLIRIEKCFLSALSVFLPAYQKTKELGLSLGYSIPIFTIIASGFVINDINDVERDHINNPRRVLPQKSITLNFAVFLYFFLILLTLVVVKFSIPIHYIFIFMLYLVLITNYNYLVNSFPYLKNLYVLIVTGVHLSIIFLLIPFNGCFYICVIMNILSQEILLDLRDLKGDGMTFPKIVGERNAMGIIVLLQILELSVLLFCNQANIQYWLLVLLILSSQALGYIFWKQKRPKHTINVLKAQIIMMFVLLL